MKKSPRQKQRYYEYLKSQAWRDKRKSAIIFYGGTCSLCPKKHNLHVHHKTYIRLFKERMEDLIVLCEDCHYLFHKKKNPVWRNGKKSKYMKDPAYDTSTTTYYPNAKKGTKPAV